MTIGFRGFACFAGLGLILLANSPASAQERLGCPTPGTEFTTTAPGAAARLTSLGGFGWVCGFRDAAGSLVGSYGHLLPVTDTLSEAVPEIREVWPLTPGRTARFSAGGTSYACAVKAKEMVTVPAGQYDAWPVECVASGSEAFVERFWYAGVLGMAVKRERLRGSSRVDADSWELAGIARVAVDPAEIAAADARFLQILARPRPLPPPPAAAVAAAGKWRPDPEQVPGWTPPDLDLMVLVPAGPFMPGRRNVSSATLELYTGPQVTLPAFLIDAYQVTNRRYAAYRKAVSVEAPRYSNRPEMSRDYQPVVAISWEEADAYCRWAGKRLPTELEWEKAAAGETEGPYPWGSEAYDAGGIFRANLGDGRTERKDGPRHGVDGFIYPAPVGSFPQDRSRYGVYDLAGNASDWTASDYVLDLYTELARAGGRPEAMTIPPGHKVVRGGSWASGPWSARLTARGFLRPRESNAATGFRCARDAGAAQ